MSRSQVADIEPARRARASLRGRAPAARLEVAGGTAYVRDAMRARRPDLAPVPRVSRLGGRGAEAFGAFAPDGDLVGEARLVRLESRPSCAEVSLTVAEGPEGRCVGRHLLTRLIGGARRAGIETFFVSCPVSSRHTIELLWEFGAEVRELGREGGIVEFEVSLPKLLEPSGESSR